MILISEQDGNEWTYAHRMENHLQSLLDTSTFEGRLKEMIALEINDTENMNKENYDKLQFKLFTNQLDRIPAGLNYSQTDILKHLRKLC